MSTSFGDLVFESLQPLFAAGPTKSYLDDFWIHDRRSFRSTAVPGIDYLWVLRPCGTHLAFLGIDGPSVPFTTLTGGEQGALAYHLVVTADGCSSRVVSPTAASLLLSRSSQLSTSTSRGLRFGQASNVEVTHHGRLVASASVLVHRPTPERPNTLVDCVAHVEASLTPQLQMLSKLHIESGIRTLAGTLFWSFSDVFTVNGDAAESWIARLTAARVPAPLS